MLAAAPAEAAGGWGERSHFMPEKKPESEAGVAEAAPHYHGHRERLRARFREAGAEALSDYELLELLLFHVMPRRDVKPLAKALVAKFGSFAEAIAAPSARLAEVKGLGEACITDFKIVQAAANRFLRGAVKKRPVLSSWSSVLDYCRTAQAFADREQFRAVSRQAQPAHRRRGSADRHCRSRAGLSARSGQARARTVGDRHRPGAQSSVRRSDAVARRHPDDAADHGGGLAARHCRARPHHRRQGRACQLEGAEADLGASNLRS
jgi:DNA repair protein RadC